MLDILKSDRFGIFLDTGHAHLTPGTGTVDFTSLFAALRESKYSGFISAELGAGYIMNPTAACKETLKFLTLLNDVSSAGS